MKKYLFVFLIVLFASSQTFAATSKKNKAKTEYSKHVKKYNVMIIRTSCMNVSLGDVTTSSLGQYLDIYTAFFMYFQNICDLYAGDYSQSFDERFS